MASYTIFSRVFAPSGSDAFVRFGPTANSLSVMWDGHLASIDGVGARLQGPAGWTASIFGQVTSQQSSAMAIDAGGPSNVTIYDDAKVVGDADGISAYTVVSIKNYGMIAGTGWAGVSLHSNQASSLVNYGVISGVYNSVGESAALGISRIVNYGTLHGDVRVAYGEDILTNWGKINGGIYSAGDGTLRLTNHGTIVGDVWASDGSDVLVNRGVITGYVFLGSDFPTDRGNSFTNSGRILGSVEASGHGEELIVNSGHIAGSVSLVFGDSVLRNTGTIAGDVLCLLVGNTNDTVINLGTIRGEIRLGAGDDSYTGGRRVDDIADSAGSDTYSLGAGNDRFVAYGRDFVDGLDTADGGAGRDTYYVLSLSGQSSAFDTLRINIDTIMHGGIAANTATGVQIGATDRIYNFENVVGSPDTDYIHGNAVANHLNGFVGDDFLWGYGGNDVLIGEFGADILVGGAGRDKLYGSFEDGQAAGGADVFVFENVFDSGKTANTRDIIFGFEDFLSLIDLAAIDANTANGAGDDAFTFIGADSFTRVAGELRVTSIAAGWLVAGDVNGDGRADFTIQVNDAAHALSFSAADFVL